MYPVLIAKINNRRGENLLMVIVRIEILRWISIRAMKELNVDKTLQLSLKNHYFTMSAYSIFFGCRYDFLW